MKLTGALLDYLLIALFNFDPSRKYFYGSIGSDYYPLGQHLFPSPARMPLCLLHLYLYSRLRYSNRAVSPYDLVISYPNTAILALLSYLKTHNTS